MTSNFTPANIQDSDRVALEVAALALVRISDIPTAPPQVALAAFDGVTHLAQLGIAAGVETGPGTTRHLLRLALRELDRLSPATSANVTVAAVRECCEYALREAV